MLAGLISAVFKGVYGLTPENVHLQNVKHVHAVTVVYYHQKHSVTLKKCQKDVCGRGSAPDVPHWDSSPPSSWLGNLLLPTLDAFSASSSLSEGGSAPPAPI